MCNIVISEFCSNSTEIAHPVNNFILADVINEEPVYIFFIETKLFQYIKSSTLVLLSTFFTLLDTWRIKKNPSIIPAWTIIYTPMTDIE